MRFKAFPVCDWWDHQDADTSFGIVILETETLRPLPLRHDAFFRSGGNDGEHEANAFATWLEQQPAANVFDPKELDQKLVEWKLLQPPTVEYLGNLRNSRR